MKNNKLLFVVHKPGGGGTEAINPNMIESMRRAGAAHVSDANTIIRTGSGREITTTENYDKSVEEWYSLLEQWRGNNG